MEKNNQDKLYSVLINANECTTPLYNIIKWMEENKLSFINDIKMISDLNNVGRKSFVAFKFQFLNENDAATFKLRWS